MDRFDDPREKKRKARYEDPRDTRQRTMRDDENNAKSKPLSLQELIAQEAALASGLSKEMAAISDGGIASEKNKLLSLAEREAFLEKKCAIVSKYQAEYQKEYEKYRRSLHKLETDKTEYGRSMYMQGVSSGKEHGKALAEEEMQPTLVSLARSRSNLRFYLGVTIAYAVLISAVFVASLFL